MKNSAPKPPYNGALSPIDHRGVPVVLPTAAATQPATATADAEVQIAPAAPSPDPLPTTVPATVPSKDEKSPGLFE